jgi:hypothetical protein
MPQHELRRGDGSVTNSHLQDTFLIQIELDSTQTENNRNQADWFTLIEVLSHKDIE